MMKSKALPLVFLCSTWVSAQSPSLHAGTLRPPAVPLVACDPYFSIWSSADKLADADTVHWTGKPHRLSCLVRVDGKVRRIMGTSPAETPALLQTRVEVLPTRTICDFEGEGIALTLTFTTPALPEDISVLSRPVTYLTWEAHAIDGLKHDVSLYFDAGSELTVNEPKQLVEWKEQRFGSLVALSCGSSEQRVLGKKGDDLRIDWGYLYIAADREWVAEKAGGVSRSTAQNAFAKGESLSYQPDGTPGVGALFMNMGTVGTAPVTRWLILAYDDLFSIQYMRENLRPFWRRTGWNAEDLLKASAREYESLLSRCVAFDGELMADLALVGGDNYAQIAALAYRQAFAAGKFASDENGQPLQFSKENHSNGCIGTSDVFYPMAPQFLLFGPSLAKSFLVPFMNYAASSRWKFPFAPHDLGTYPHANGQVYGGGELTEKDQMPVEESGNLLLLIAAVAEMEGNPSFASRYWPKLEQWAEYLKAKGFDPENQLCTDDFAGHLAHNVNLSAKAICGLGAFAKLCRMRGETAKADEFFALARSFAARWIQEAADGDHYRLAFDKAGTWSQKYNLLWDQMLDLNIFPKEVARTEMEFYKKIQNRYGLPLDNRETYTKLDWILWTATLTQNRADFEALVNPVYLFLNETPDRSPMTDWYQTKTARKVGFTARPVVGGVFAPVLYDKKLWSKYAARDKTRASDWAPIPEPVTMKVVLPAADTESSIWYYTTNKPSATWTQPGFDCSGWQKGPSGFGTPQTPSSKVGTRWNTSEIWLRREAELPAGNLTGVLGWLHHDEDVEVYINGILAVQGSGFTTSYDAVPLIKASAASLHSGKNTIAIYCRQTGGGQYVDFGLVEAGKDRSK